MPSIEELRAQAKELRAQIQAQGGRGSAPKLTKQLSDIQGQILSGGGNVKAPVGGTKAGGKSGNRGGKIGGKIAKSVNKGLGKASTIAGNVLDLDPLSTLNPARVDETNDLISRFGGRADTAGDRSKGMSSFLDRLLASTEGYSSRENQAAREQMNREVDRGFQGGQAALDRKANQYRVGGVQRLSQIGELARDFGQLKTDNEQDLFVKNADEKQKRLETYGTKLGEAEQSEFDRADTALKGFRDVIADARKYETEVDTINLGQEAASKALGNAGTLGIFGILDARRAAKKMAKLAAEGRASAEEIAAMNAEALKAANESLANAQITVADKYIAAQQDQDDSF